MKYTSTTIIITEKWGRLTQYAILCLLAASFLGCVTSGSDNWDMMRQSAGRLDAHFPDEDKVLLVRFAHIGFVETPDGRMNVVDCRAVITGMLAPRGLHWISLFNDQCEFVGRIHTSNAADRCKGSKLFLEDKPGSVDGECIAESTENHEGNVIDFAKGFMHARLYQERRNSSATMDGAESQ